MLKILAWRIACKKNAVILKQLCGGVPMFVISPFVEQLERGDGEWQLIFQEWYNLLIHVLL